VADEFYYGDFMMSFPENIIKGIPNKKGFIIDGLVSASLFEFKDYSRIDKQLETSINWEDDEEAINFTFNQKNKDDTLQFKGGLVILPRNQVDNLINQPTLRGILSYERQPIPKINKYHGNILIAENTPRHFWKRIAGSLALHVSKIIFRP
jgi:hypothetical protein